MLAARLILEVLPIDTNSISHRMQLVQGVGDQVRHLHPAELTERPLVHIVNVDSHANIQIANALQHR